MGKTKIRQKSSGTRSKSSRKKNYNRRRTMRKYKGGVGFNSIITFPQQYTYPDNLLNIQPDRAPLVVDTRLLTEPYQVAGKRASKKRRRKMTGGWSIINDNLLLGSNEMSNAPLAFGTTSGSKWMTNEIGAVKRFDGPYLSAGEIKSSLV
jgi:hypothetical protein